MKGVCLGWSVWIRDHNGSQGNIKQTHWGVRYEKQKKTDIQSETVADGSKKEKAHISHDGVITSESAACSDTSAFPRFRPAVIKHAEILYSSAVTVRVQVWKLAIRSRGGLFAVTLETSSGLWSYLALRCLPDGRLFQRRRRWWGEGKMSKVVKCSFH